MVKPYMDFAGRLSTRVLARLSLIEAQFNFDFGDEYEVAICEVLTDILPARYGVCRGSLVTFEGEEAGDDLIIFDRLSYPTLRSSIAPNFAVKERVPIEAAYAYIECKHRVELGAGLEASKVLATAVEQVRNAKKLAAKRVPNPNPHFKDQPRFILKKRGDWPAYYPQLKNELFGVVFARHAPTRNDSIGVSQIRVGGEHAPDLMILGPDRLFSPAAYLGADGIKGSMYFSSAFESHLHPEEFPGDAIGLGLLTLMHVIGWMELLPIDFANVLNGCFWDAVGRRRDAHE
jgi:hypothetical protein